ncbi:MAG: hypothetical protein HY343_05435 [Lentisphaerae bacterium]|nr:hypothetical protein [Lentisphaerota bacterium]
MKTFLWLMVVALAVLCVGCWCFAFLVMQYLRDFRVAFAVPNLTRLVLMPYTWLLFCPLPWLLCAIILNVRREISQSAVFIFAGTVAIAMVVIFCAVGLAAFVGVVPFKL